MKDFKNRKPKRFSSAAFWGWIGVSSSGKSLKLKRVEGGYNNGKWRQIIDDFLKNLGPWYKSKWTSDVQVVEWMLPLIERKEVKIN